MADPEISVEIWRILSNQAQPERAVAGSAIPVLESVAKLRQSKEKQWAFGMGPSAAFHLGSRSQNCRQGGEDADPRPEGSFQTISVSAPRKNRSARASAARKRTPRRTGVDRVVPLADGQM